MGSVARVNMGWEDIVQGVYYLIGIVVVVIAYILWRIDGDIGAFFARAVPPWWVGLPVGIIFIVLVIYGLSMRNG